MNDRRARAPGAGRLYHAFFTLVLRRISAETAHHLAFFALRIALALSFLRRRIARRLAPDPILRTRALGFDFPSPIGLAAGFDKNALGPAKLAALGFGYVEIGTVTARPQPGNPKPRVFRLPPDRALVNRMGFGNDGAEAIAARLPHTRGEGIVGVNIGKTKVVDESDAIADYVASTRRLARVADYLVVNVSSPNTPGLRALQAVDKLGPLLAAVRAAADAAVTGRRLPLLVKIAPDLADADVDAVADLALSLGLDGIIATNTTFGRAGLTTPTDEVERIGAGGLSGAPLKARALEVTKRLRARVGDRLVLIAAGGIETAQDAFDQLRAGATLVQVYTAFVYGGPLFPARLSRDLATLLRASRHAGQPAANAASPEALHV